MKWDLQALSQCNKYQYFCFFFFCLFLLVCLFLLLFQRLCIISISSLFTLQLWGSNSMSHTEWLIFFLWRVKNGIQRETGEELSFPSLPFLFLHFCHVFWCLHRLGCLRVSTKSVAPFSSQLFPSLQSDIGRKGREQIRQDDLLALMVCVCQPHWWDLYGKKILVSFSICIPAIHPPPPVNIFLLLSILHLVKLYIRWFWKLHFWKPKIWPHFHVGGWQQFIISIYIVFYLSLKTRRIFTFRKSYRNCTSSKSASARQAGDFLTEQKRT